MKLNTLLIYSFSCLLFLACNKQTKTKEISENNKTTTLLKGEYLIKGQTFNANYKSIYLYQYLHDSLIPIDTTFVVDNHFEFKGEINNPIFFSIKTGASDNAFRFLVDESEIDVFLHDNLYYSSTYSNSSIQKKHTEYTSKMNGFRDKGVGLYYGLKGNFSKSNIDNLKKERSNLFKDQSDYLIDFIKTNNNSYISVLLIEDNLRYYHHKKIRELYEYLAPSIKDLPISKKLDSNLIALENAKKTIPTTTPSKPKPSREYRPNAYAFSGLNPDGNTMSLASIPQGKVVLLDFWASWCGPCRATNPNLVQLYNKYKNRGLVIMSISEDKGESEWISAIYEDNLTWDYHVLDKNKSIAFRYGVESIPHKILIDKQGRIASDKISGRALEQRIQQLLAE